MVGVLALQLCLAVIAVRLIYCFGANQPVVVRMVIGAAFLAFPFVFKSVGVLPQSVLAGYAVIGACKNFEYGVGKTADRRMWDSFARFVVWWTVPPDCKVPHSPWEMAQNRASAMRKALRGGLKLSAFFVLLSVNRFAPNVLESVPLFCAWSMPLLYFAVSGVADFVCSGAGLIGFAVEEAFRNPFVSRNSVEFWSVRWNRFVHGFARRYCFWSWGGRRHPAAATLLVFFASGLMHEYMLVATAQEIGSYAGWMTAFFLLQGVAVLYVGFRARIREPRLSRTTAVAIHTLWMWCTSPLFFLPLEEAMGYSEWSL